MKKIILLSVMVLCGFMSTYAASVFAVATPLCTVDTVHDTIYVTVYDTIYEGVHDTVYRDTVTDTVYTAPEFKSLQVQADVPAQSEADAYGQVSGNGTFPLNSEVEIAAIPNRGCRFMGWGDGNQENPRTVVLDGDRVYVALMEHAAMLTVAPSLSPGETTVGGQISITHLAPSAVGAEIAATAVLERIEGKKLTFSVSAKEGDKLIGEGTHVRFIVNKEKFISKLNNSSNV